MSSSAHQSEDEDDEVLQVEGRPRRTRRAPTNQDSDDQAGPSRTAAAGDDPSEDDDDDDDDFRAAVRSRLPFPFVSRSCSCPLHAPSRRVERLDG